MVKKENSITLDELINIAGESTPIPLEAPQVGEVLSLERFADRLEQSGYRAASPGGWCRLEDGREVLAVMIVKEKDK